MMRPLSRLSLIALACAACDDPTIPPLGKIEVTASTPLQGGGVQTVDGWTIKAERFLVVASATVGGADGVVAASSGSVLLDPSTAARSLISDDTRRARHWEAFSFQVAPPLPEGEEEQTSVTEPATEEDLAQMRSGGYSIFLKGRATKGAVTKTFEWGFATNTLYESCQATVGGVVVPGMVVPAGGSDTVDVGLSFAVLFGERLPGEGETIPAPRFEALAAADTNADGAVSLEELRGISLEAARAAAAEPAAYAVGSRTEIENLATFSEELSRHIVTTFRGTGACTVAPAAP